VIYYHLVVEMAGGKILVVEDDRTLLDVLKYNLAKEGYIVITATDGVQALEVARHEKPQLYLSLILCFLNWMALRYAVSCGGK